MRKSYLIGPTTALLGLAAIAATTATAAPAFANEPYPCRLLDDQRRKCAFGDCDYRVIEQLKKECLLDGGTIRWPTNAE